MPKRRIAMHKIKRILRLSHEAGRSQREIARACGLTQPSVQRVLKRAREVGLGWPLPEELDEEALAARLYGERPRRAAARDAQPDFQAVRKQLKKYKHVTLERLWQEYREGCPEGYSYSHFCALYARWRQSRDPVLRQDHKAGEKLFIDYAGLTVTVHAPEGEFEAQLFVAVLGASSYTYVEASRGQDLRSWLGSHVRALHFFGGAPALLVPDNLKSAVTWPCRYEPVENRSYAEFAEHYGMSVVPARPHKPRDKAKAEAGVLVAERQILAALRHQRFRSLADLNAAIRKKLDELNRAPFQKREGSRRSLFEELDRPALRPLPAQDYEFAEWRTAKVHIDYHVAVLGHYYSAPWELIGQRVDVRVTESCVELLRGGRRVALHQRGHLKGGCTTLEAHRPRRHRKHLEWTPERMRKWSLRTGPCTERLTRDMLGRVRHPEKRYRACLGIMRLSKRYGADRMEAAARRALHYGTGSYRSVKTILANNLDKLPLEPTPQTASPAAASHENVRGPGYYAAPRHGKGGERC